jgi:hypothetical protein
MNITAGEELKEHFENEDGAPNDLVELIDFVGAEKVIRAIVDLNLDSSTLKQRSRRIGNLCQQFISSVSHGLNNDALSLPMADWLTDSFDNQHIKALSKHFAGELAGFERMITDLQEGISSEGREPGLLNLNGGLLGLPLERLPQIEWPKTSKRPV